MKQWWQQDFVYETLRMSIKCDRFTISPTSYIHLMVECTFIIQIDTNMMCDDRQIQIFGYFKRRTMYFIHRCIGTPYCTLYTIHTVQTVLYRVQSNKI